MMSDSWSHAAAFDLPMVPGVTVLSAVPGTEAFVLVSEMVTLMPLTPEMAERVSQTFGFSTGDVGELSILISADPRSFWALFVIGAEMDRTSWLGCFFDRRCGKGNLSLVEPPILDFDQRLADCRGPSPSLSSQTGHCGPPMPDSLGQFRASRSSPRSRGVVGMCRGWIQCFPSHTQIHLRTYAVAPDYDAP